MAIRAIGNLIARARASMAGRCLHGRDIMGTPYFKVTFTTQADSTLTAGLSLWLASKR